MITKIVSSWKIISGINILWIAWFMVYLFVWTPNDKTPATLEGFFYGLSVIPFAVLICLGIAGILHLIQGGRNTTH